MTELCCRNCLCASIVRSEDDLQQCSAYRRAICAREMFFNLTSFHPGQLEAILPVLHGKDVFVRIPTGGGKSLCMYISVLAHEPDKMDVIISPLVGLMDEQVSCMHLLDY